MDLKFQWLKNTKNVMGLILRKNLLIHSSIAKYWEIFIQNFTVEPVAESDLLVKNSRYISAGFR